MNPEVSILIPVYNREKLLQPCVESALAQTHTNLEVVIFDNCSTDATWTVCEKLAQQDPRVRIFRNEKNLGPVRNWLRCVEEARAPLAKLLFSDDLLDPGYLRATIPLMANPQTALVFTAVRYLRESGRKGADIAHLWPGRSAIWDSPDYLHRALNFKDMPVSPGAALFRTTDLRQNLMIDIPSPTVKDFSATGAGPDFLLYLLTAVNYPQIAYIPAPLAIFRAHVGSISITMPSRVKIQYLHACIWFSQKYGFKRELRHLLRRAWWVHSEDEGHLFDYTQFANKFSPHEFSPDLNDHIFVFTHTFHFWRRRAKRAIKRRFSSKVEL